MEEVKLLRDLNIGRICMDFEISKSYDGGVAENISEPSPNIKEGGIVILGTGSCLQ